MPVGFTYTKQPIPPGEFPPRARKAQLFRPAPFRNLAFLWVGLLMTLPSVAQVSSQTSFGKNRVQYHRQFDDWLLYETPNFTTYWYGDARNIAQAALQVAELDYPELQQLLEHQMTDKIEMLVFTDITDVKQSNIGTDEMLQLKTGEIPIQGNKLFIHFDGNHQNLRIQVRKGIATVLCNSMLFGSNWQEIVQNSVLLNLPAWYTEGLVQYCGAPWDEEMDSALRFLFSEKKIKSFDLFAKEYPALAGRAFWFFIAQQYGKGSISNLLYLTRINRSIDAGFLYVLGMGYKRTTKALMAYLENRYRSGKDNLEPPESPPLPIKNKRKRPISQAKISPDGKRMAWVVNSMGSWSVRVAELPNSRPTIVLRGGVRNALHSPDYNYPLLAWSPDGKLLTALTERRDVLRLEHIDPQHGKKQARELSPDYQRVFSMDYWSADELIFSASVKGYSDLFRYRLKTRQTNRITQDFWDDLDATVGVLDNKKGVFFASNRCSDTLKVEKMDTILPLRHFDIFFYDPAGNPNEVIRLTHTPDREERQPVPAINGHFSFITHQNGLKNRGAGTLVPYTACYLDVFYLKNGSEVKSLNPHLPGQWTLPEGTRRFALRDSVEKYLDTTLIDSVRTIPLILLQPKTWLQTNLNRNLIGLHSGANGTQLLETHQEGFKQTLHLTTFHPNREIEARSIADSSASMPDESTYKNSLPAKKDTATHIPPGWLFQVPEHLAKPTPSAKTPPVFPQNMPDPLNNPNLQSYSLPKNPRITRFNPSKIIPYRLRFRTDYVSSTLDNNLLFEGLESYAGSPEQFQTPNPGVLMKANFKDLLENYVLETGFRMPVTFRGAEYYLTFDQKKARLDKRMALYRKTHTTKVDESKPGSPKEPFQVRNITLLGQYEVKYPFDPFFSLRGLATIRQDKALTLISDFPTLQTPTFNEQRAALRLSAVYDNTVNIDLNRRTGTRAKCWVEVVKKFAANVDPSPRVQFNRGVMTVLAWDARHYEPLGRHAILALRTAGATSFGSEKMLYLLGGIDNWILPRFNDNIPLPSTEGFAYQTLATNLHGFDQNIRNGNSFALINTELRLPLFRYLSKKPVMGNFWRNFLVVGFFDAGTAWQGRSPYRGDNPINSVVLTDGPIGQPPVVTIRVNYFRDPLVVGYGFGLRAQILGLYLRADYSWGIETRIVQKPIFQAALGLDF